MSKVQLVLHHEQPEQVATAISDSAELFAARKARRAEIVDVLREGVVAFQMERTILRAVAKDDDNIVEYSDD